jgi:hypothetical protein
MRHSFLFGDQSDFGGGKQKDHRLEGDGLALDSVQPGNFFPS